MAIIKIFLILFIIPLTVVDGRALRERRQTMTSPLSQGVNNFLSNSYNTIRDTVVPAIGSTIDRFSQNWDQYKQGFNQGINQIGQNWDQYKQGFNQGVNQIGQNWDRYKQNFNQGINQFSQGWNQFTQNYIPQNPFNYNNNYAYNQYGYNAQQNPYPMTYNNNFPPNMYQNYYGRQGNQYPPNNNFNWYEPPRNNNPYYTGNAGGQRYANGAIAPNSAVYNYQRAGSSRK